MKAKKRILTAATLSAFLALGGLALGQNTGDKSAKTGTAKKPEKVSKAHKGGKKGHKGGKKSTKGTTTPPPK